MDQRLKNYCDINKFFLENVCSVQDCLIEANKVQKTLLELVELKSEFERTLSDISRKFDKFMSEHRAMVKQVLDRNGVKNVTREVIEDRVISNYEQGYLELKIPYDEAKLNAELCNDLRFIFLQRKDLITETISFMKSRHESESCIFNNKKFIEKVSKIL